MSDFYDYIFKFPDKGTASNDTILAPFFAVPPPAGANPPVELLIYANAQKNSVVPESGFWFTICCLGLNATLAAHPNLQIVNDRTLMLSGAPSIISSTFDTTNMRAIFSNFGAYTTTGLTMPSEAIPITFG